MTRAEEGRRVSRLVGGAILLLVGLVLVLRNFGVLEWGSIGDFWPMVLIWVGATRLLAPGRGERIASGLVVLGLGVFFQLERLGWIDASLRDLWPALLVGAGAAMILEGMRGRRAASSSSSPPKGPESPAAPAGPFVGGQP